MLKNLSKLAFLTTGCVLGLTAFQVPILKAATITTAIQVAIDSGPLLNNTYTGSFSYDDSSLTGIGIELISPSDLAFTFEGNDYTQADDPNAKARFSDGEFLGLDFSVPPFPGFSFISGDFDVSEAFFAYDLGFVDAGTGTVDYLVLPCLYNSCSSVPEPSATFGLLSLISLGFVSLVSQRKA